MIVNFRHGRYVQGGSTITQQMAKNLLYSDKTIFRKLKEALLSYRLEHTFPKEKIMELYLNTIYLGRGLYGVNTAARGYFGKTLSDLTWGEIAFITALAKAPSFYAANLDHDSFLDRRKYVISRLLGEHFLSEEELSDPDMHNVKVLKQEKGHFLPILAHDLVKMIKHEYGVIKEFALHQPLDMSLQSTLKLEALQKVQKLVDNKKWKSIMGEEYTHNVMVIDQSTSGVIAFNTNHKPASHSSSLHHSFRALLLQEYLKLVYLIQNQKHVSEEILQSSVNPSYEFVTKVLAFERFKQLLDEVMERYLKNFTLFQNESYLKAYLKNQLLWNYGNLTHFSFYELQVKFAEIFLSFRDKRSFAPHTIHEVVTSDKKSDEIHFENKIPLNNQINCDVSYVERLQEFFDFLSIQVFSSVKGVSPKDLKGLYLIPSLTEIGASVLIFSARNHLLLIFSFPKDSIPPSQEIKKLQQNLVRNQISLLKQVHSALTTLTK